MYKIIGADGKEYGPVSGDQLRQWFAEGRVNGQTQVLAEGAANWQALSSIQEFSAPPPPFSATQYGSATVQKTNTMAITGMIMGIISVCLCCYGIPFSVLGIVFSAIGLSQIKNDPLGQQGRGMAIAGLILSIIGLLIVVVFFLCIGISSGLH